MSDEFTTRIEQARQARKQTLAEWRYNRIKELPEPLPVSKIRMFVRDVTMMDLVFTGRLPEPVLVMLDEAQKNKQQDLDLKNIARNGDEFRQMVDALVILMAVEPPVAETGDDDHIGIGELAGDDKMFIFNFANREVKALKENSFRDEIQPVETVQPINSLQHETKPIAGAGN